MYNVHFLVQPVSIETGVVALCSSAWPEDTRLFNEIKVRGGLAFVQLGYFPSEVESTFAPFVSFFR
jgi:hypothetical protein